MFNYFRRKEKGNRNHKFDANARPGAITAQSIYKNNYEARHLARRKENFGKEENSHAFVRASATPGILYSLRDLLRVARGN
uniref:Uncharacterized protein n=1 Tax=Trichogramma kaykai TaxID=54128 RepID=A0ABD2WXN4_9HYME